MKAYKPNYIFSKTTNITLEFLKQNGIKNLLLDVDNTLTTHGNPIPAEGIVDWIKTMQDGGIKLMIVSNNYKKRVGPFADSLNLAYHSFSAKPTPFAMLKCAKALGGTVKDTAMVGDQIFTDILGANLCGMMSILVLVMQEEDHVGFKLKRKFEKKYIDEYIKENNGVL